jgi:hypothetical protein
METTQAKPPQFQKMKKRCKGRGWATAYGWGGLVQGDLHAQERHPGGHFLSRVRPADSSAGYSARAGKLLPPSLPPSVSGGLPKDVAAFVGLQLKAVAGLGGVA